MDQSFPVSPEKVQIADEAINGVSSNNGGGVHFQHRHRSITKVKEHAVSEKEVNDCGDDRDIRKKQVNTDGRR